MKKLSILLLIIVVSLTTQINAQQWEEVMQTKKGTLDVHYFENEPYAYTAKNGKLVGIEIDILNAFVEWAKKEKEVEIDLNFKPAYSEFDQFYRSISAAPTNSIGLGSVTITSSREGELKFSAPYLKNVSVLITDGLVPTARTPQALENMVMDLRPLAIKGSVHQSHLQELYKNSETKVTYDYVKAVEMIPTKIKESGKYFGYVDIISFWKYVKNNKHYVKMHTIANKENEEFGFVVPKISDWDVIINEFFESGFGFTSTKAYHKILEKHLSFEIIERVEMD